MHRFRYPTVRALTATVALFGGRRSMSPESNRLAN